MFRTITLHATVEQKSHREYRAPVKPQRRQHGNDQTMTSMMLWANSIHRAQQHHIYREANTGSHAFSKRPRRNGMVWDTAL